MLAHLFFCKFMGKGDKEKMDFWSGSNYRLQHWHFTTVTEKNMFPLRVDKKWWIRDQWAGEYIGGKNDL